MFITSAPSSLPSVSPLTSAPTGVPSFTGIVTFVQISRPTTSEITSSEIHELETIVTQAYGVDPEDLTTVTEYVTTGTMVIEIDPSIPNEEGIGELTSALASTIGINKNDIGITINFETGEVTYSVSSEDYDTSVSILDTLDNENIMDVLNEESDIISVIKFASNEEIFGEVRVIVNADDVTVPLQQAENIIDTILGTNYEITTDISFVTSAPTMYPSTTPSTLPTSTIPSALPTITGAVAFIRMQKRVIAELTNDEIADLISSAESEFGIFPGAVDLNIEYVIKGTVDVEFDGSDYSEEELISTLQQSISEALNLHISDIEVTFNSETGEAAYTIASDTIESALVLQEELIDPTINDEIMSVMAETVPSVTNVTF